MVNTLKNINDKTNELIMKCKSSSNVCGLALRNAHYNLGKCLGNQIATERILIDMKIAVLLMMRAGLPFGLGIADELEKNNKIKIFFSTQENDFSDFDLVIIADAVINTGKTVLEEKQKLINKKVIVATNVLSDKYLDKFSELDIYTVRISEHSYKGSNSKVIANGTGPDTGERLFSNTFFN